MLCKSPFMKGQIPCGCGQCMPCRFNRRRLVTHRILLESMCHGDNAFITLTYDEKNLPAGGTLVPLDAQLFLKRLRAHYAPARLRYYLVGEYGENNQRPHYHAVVFGLPTCRNGRTRHPRSASERFRCCGPCSDLHALWGLGRIDIGELNLHSAQYIAGYVTKKMTKFDDPRLAGRYPEFARMSLRPGIGALSVEQIASVLSSGYGQAFVSESGDVPVSLKSGGKSLPLGRYLRRKLREKLGRSPDAPKEIAEAYAKELHRLYKDAIADPSFESVPGSFKDARSVYLKQNVQKFRNLDARTKLFGAKRGVL